ncbi:MAG TPA: hypothetical protein VHK27_09135 [Gammaproteobacteria bacterium]|nr:hypothetical protein [Gammaproteobacteria bacterium]
MRLPRIISPQMHHRIDLVALPSVITLVVWMSRRNRRVAALMSMIAAGEAAALLTTDYPPGFLRWISFRDHIWAATLHGILAASLALLVPGIPPRDRRVMLALAAMPIVLSALSDTREK